VPAPTPTIADIHRNIDALAAPVHRGDPNAIAQLSETIFQRVGIPPEVAGVFHFSQRVAQAETDYRKGVQPAVHEEDLVMAHNNFARTLGLPEWAFTTPEEVRQVRMQFVARYPQLLGNNAPPDKTGRLALLSSNISPTEAVFLASSLLYQKLYNPDYQLTAKERAGNTPLEASVVHERTVQLYNVVHGKTESVDVVDLAHAANGLFNDLHIGASLRPEFEFLPSPISAKGGR
jgi:hypothetical protein